MNIDLYCDIYPEIADRHPIAIEQWQEWFTIWANYLQSEQAIVDGDYEVSLAIADDLTIQQLNLQYRQKDCPTDVLSFAALESAVPEIPIDDCEDFDYIEPTSWGDIIISQTTAIRQAEERGHSLTYELAWLAAHGLLHLLGWDHPDDESLEAMLAQQDNMLQLIALL
ncbi:MULTISPECIES: rRNA maturation RNase YbeY [Pseudanabaena]|uniref:Endoribonuclease YbeY n=2 Tax=Pseudanabaena TaxID=1152 RepID=L8MVN4_9CYAN|nr:MULTISPECIES: rRNA maturation RNase YbeY [Pseudanabaena]ELS30530.1 metalloprotease ybeY [Pseudanabaena biceps PCC 7429]MDG3497202.1 rRNA maturation RNase YbeY [Pseudanabaena catenata USMAC16]